MSLRADGPRDVAWYFRALDPPLLRPVQLPPAVRDPARPAPSLLELPDRPERLRRRRPAVPLGHGDLGPALRGDGARSRWPGPSGTWGPSRRSVESRDRERAQANRLPPGRAPAASRRPRRRRLSPPADVGPRCRRRVRPRGRARARAGAPVPRLRPLPGRRSSRRPAGRAQRRAKQRARRRLPPGRRAALPPLPAASEPPRRRPRCVADGSAATRSAARAATDPVSRSAAQPVGLRAGLPEARLRRPPAHRARAVHARRDEGLVPGDLPPRLRRPGAAADVDQLLKSEGLGR